MMTETFETKPKANPSLTERQERWSYIQKRRAEGATVQTIATELGIAKQNVGRYLVRGQVLPTGRQRTNVGRKQRLTKRITLWQSRRLSKLQQGLDVSYEEGWIADLEGRLLKLG